MQTGLRQHLIIALAALNKGACVVDMGSASVDLPVADALEFVDELLSVLLVIERRVSNATCAIDELATVGMLRD